MIIYYKYPDKISYTESAALNCKMQETETADHLCAKSDLNGEQVSAPLTVGSAVVRQ